MVNRTRPVLTEHLRTVGGADCTQFVGLRPIGAFNLTNGPYGVRAAREVK
jgi:hypothetical protein